MGTERRNYVMTVGLAMQREMAYRHKLHNLTSQRLASTSQAPKPTPHSVPTRPYSGPRPGHPPHPRPNIWFRGPVPGIMMVARPQFQGPYPRPGPPPGPTHSTIGQKRKQPLQGETYLCDLCQIDCDNAFNLKAHLKGQKHMAKLNGTELTKITTPSETRVMGQSDWIRCGLCDVWCSSEITLSQHVNGKNHIAKLRASGQS